MARIPGERFDLDLDDAASRGGPQAASSTSMPGFIGDVLERQTPSDMAPPTFKNQSATTGFPEHKKRTPGLSKFKQSRGGAGSEAAAPAGQPSVSTSTTTATATAATPDISVTSPLTPAGDNGKKSGNFEAQQIDVENKRTIASMSAEEIQQERQELFAGLSPALIEKLLRRSNIDDEPQKLEPDASPKARPADAANRRPSYSDRRVSFALPEEQIQEKEPAPTASRHSITSSPSPRLAARADLSSTDVSELGLSRTSSNTSIASRRSSSSQSHERKVSFVLPDYIELARKASPTAAKHSVSSPMSVVSDKVAPVQTQDITDLDLTKIPSSVLKSPGQRPVDHNRRVSFALPDSQLDLSRIPSSAASHSISGTPSPKFLDKPDPVSDDQVENFQLPLPAVAEGGSIHFPKPPAAPELDPNSTTFLTDLHEKYFPNLAHDPSKLAWMAPATEAENASYDPSRANLDPKDIRFDFKGAIIPPSKSAQIPTDVGLHHHGDAPSAAGYTIAELGLLARSAFPAQRSLAIQTVGRILFRLGKGEFGNENDVDVDGPDGERGMLAKGLWEAVEANRVIDTITAEAARDRGHQTSIALAQEAVWNWRKGGGRQRKAV